MSIITEALKKAESQRVQLASTAGTAPQAGAAKGASRAADGLPTRHVSVASRNAGSGVTGPRDRNSRGRRSYIAAAGIFVSLLLMITVHLLLTSREDGMPPMAIGPSGPVAEPYGKASYDALLAERHISAAGEAATDEDQISSVKLNGIVNDGAEIIAVLNNEIMRVGDKIGRAELVGIKADRVVLSLNGRNFDVLLK